MRFAAPERRPRQPADAAFLGLSPALTARLAESAVFALVALLAVLLVARPLTRRLTATLVPAARRRPRGQRLRRRRRTCGHRRSIGGRDGSEMANCRR